MSRITAHHIERGPSLMYPVDVAHAVGSHPFEWSRVPWTDEAKAEAMPKLRKQRQDAQKAARADRENFEGAGVLMAEGNHIGAQTGMPQPLGAGAYPPPTSDPQRVRDGKAEAGSGDQTPVTSKVTTDNDKAVEQAKGGKADKS